MSHAEREAYYRHIDNAVILRDNIITARGEGRLEGLEEGRKEGIEEGRKEGIEKGKAEAMREMARNLKRMGMSAEDIAKATGMSLCEIGGL